MDIIKSKKFTSFKKNFEIELDIDIFRKISYLQIVKFNNEATELALLLNDIMDYLELHNIHCVIQKVSTSDYENELKKNKYFEKIGGDDKICEISCDSKNLGIAIMTGLGFDI